MKKFKKPKFSRSNTAAQLFSNKKQFLINNPIIKKFTKIGPKTTEDVSRKRSVKKKKTYPYFLMKKTFVQEEKYKKLMDEFLLRRGVGLSKCMRAMRIFINSEDRSTELCLCICRDFCCSWCIFVVEILVNNSNITFSRITAAYPLWDKFSFKPLNEKQFDLYENKKKILSFIVNEPKSVKLFENTINYIRKKNIKKSFEKKETFLQRICTIDFIKQFWDLPPKEDIRKLLKRMLKYNGSFSSSKWCNLISIFQNQLYHFSQRQLALKNLLFHLNSKTFTIKEIFICCEIYKIFLFFPNCNTLQQNQNLEIFFRFYEFFSEIKQKYKEIARECNIESILRLTEKYYQMMIEFKGRGFLTKKKFNPLEGFFPIIRKENQLTVQNPLKQGKYFGILVYCIEKKTNGDEEIQILTSKNGKKFPVFHINFSMEYNDSDLIWILELGSDYVNLCKNLEQKKNNLNLFQKKFVKSVVNASQVVNNNLGDIYPSPIFFKNNILFLSVLLTNKNSYLYRKTQFKWTVLQNFEHSYYCTFFGLKFEDPVEFLDIRFFSGKKFISSVKSFLTKKKKTGTYIGYVRYIEKHTGMFILVERESHFIPSEFIHSSFPTDNEFKAIQKIRFDNTLSTFLDLSEIESLHPDEKLSSKNRTFKQNFYISFQNLQRKFPSVDINHMYDSELIEFNEENTIKMILFVEKVYSSENINSKEYKFIDLRIFSSIYNRIHNSVCFRKYNQQIIKIKQENDFCVYNDSTYSIDEIFLQSNDHILPELPIKLLINLELKWNFCMNWMLRVEKWVDEGSFSIAVGSGGIEKFSDFALSLVEGKKKFFFSNVSKLRDKLIEILKIKDLSFLEFEKFYNNYMSENSVKIVENNQNKRNEMEKKRNLKFSETVNFNFCDLLNEKKFREEPTSYEYCKDIFDEIVEKSLILTVDSNEIDVCRNVIEDLVDVIETTNYLVEFTVFNDLKEKKIENLINERKTLKKNFLNFFKSFGNKGDSTKLEENILSYDSIIKNYVFKFENFIKKITEIVRVIDSMQSTFEVVEKIEKMELLLEKKQELTIPKEKVFEKKSRRIKKRRKKILSKHNLCSTQLGEEELNSLYSDLKNKTTTFLEEDLKELKIDESYEELPLCILNEEENERTIKLYDLSSQRKKKKEVKIIKNTKRRGIKTRNFTLKERIGSKKHFFSKNIKT